MVHPRQLIYTFGLQSKLGIISEDMLLNPTEDPGSTWNERVAEYLDWITPVASPNSRILEVFLIYRIIEGDEAGEEKPEMLEMMQCESY